MKELSETNKAYLAGFIDGEGCIHISKWQGKNNRTPVYCLNVVISQKGAKSKFLLSALRDLTGGIGSIHEESADPSMQAWRINPNDAVDLLKAVLPYLILRKEEAEIAIEYQWKQGHKNSTGKGYVVPPEIVAEKEAFYQRLHALKGTSGLRGRPKKVRT
jgi:hypothetical protein